MVNECEPSPASGELESLAVLYLEANRSPENFIRYYKVKGCSNGFYTLPGAETISEGMLLLPGEPHNNPLPDILFQILSRISEKEKEKIIFIPEIQWYVQYNEVSQGWVTLVFTKFRRNQDVQQTHGGKDFPGNGEDSFFEYAFNWEFMTDTQGNMVRVSPSCERLSGYNAKAFLSDPGLLRRIIFPEDRHLVEVPEEDAVHDVFFRIVTASGQLKWVRHICQPVLSGAGKVIGRRATHMDVTELREIMLELDESRRRMQTLMGNLPGMAYRCKNDPDWTMEFISRGCLELTGYPSSDLIGNKRLSYNDIIHPDHQERLWRKWQALLSAHEDFYDEYPIVTASGEVKWVIEKGCGVFDSDDNLVALEGFIWDNTHHRFILDELRRERKQLNELNALKDKLFTLIAHDLRNPVNSMLGFSELLYKGYGDFSENDRIRFSASLYASATAMHRLLLNLLDWSRIQTGKFVPDFIEVDLFEVVADIISFYLPDAEKKQVKLLPGIIAGTRIRTDEYALSIILRNLISNAIKFSLPGGMIQVNITRNEDQILIRVDDQGIGMTEDELVLINSGSGLQSKTGTALETGTGLGLMLCFEFAGLIGARVYAKSRTGKGTSFFLEIPSDS